MADMSESCGMICDWLRKNKEQYNWNRTPPAVKPFHAPNIQQYQKFDNQGITQNDFSTSHQYLQRYGMRGSHF